MKKSFIVVSIFLSIFLISYSAQSATLTVDATELGILAPDGIYSYQMNFDASAGGWFTAGTSVTFSPDQPAIFQTLGSANLTASNTLVVLSENNFSSNPDNFLNDGGLFTVIYPDAVTLALSFDSFVRASDFTTTVPMIKNPDGIIFGAGDNTLTVSPVPIPGSILLLGSGLVGLIGLARRKRS